MKVWIVLGQQFEDTIIEAVCLSEEKAIEQMAKAVDRKQLYCSYTIEEHEVVQ